MYTMCILQMRLNQELIYATKFLRKESHEERFYRSAALIDLLKIDKVANFVRCEERGTEK